MRDERDLATADMFPPQLSPPPAGSLPLVADFTAAIRRPKGYQGGMMAQLFAGNGRDADAVLNLARSQVQDALVDVELCDAGGSVLGGFQAYVRRPQPRMSGMVATFYAENGDNADAITALSLSKYQDASVRVVVRLVQTADGEDARPVKGPHSNSAAVLWKSSFLGCSEVWQAAGTDGDYLDWVRAQSCCVKGSPCDGDIVPMHVRRIAAGAGAGIKPEYSAIPGCHRHHSLQHAAGESAVGGKDFYDKQRMQHLRRWAWERIKQSIGVASMADAAPSLVRRWAAERGVEHLMPLHYRDDNGN